MILLLCLLYPVLVEPAPSQEEGGEFIFEGNIQQVAMASSYFYIATEDKLYQLSHNLTLIHILTLRGILKNEDQMDNQEFHRISEIALFNATFSINVLMPFIRNNTLISYGETDHNCGYCEVLDLKNISKVLYREPIQVGPRRSISGSVSFLVDVKKDSGQTETYILTAIQSHRETGEDSCLSDLEMINLHNTNYKQDGDIFSSGGSSSLPRITAEADVGFVDGFQINSTVYLLSNVASGNKPNKVRLIWLQAETSKSKTLKSLRGATLRTSDGGEGSRLLASSVIPGGQQVLWSGVFSLDGGLTNTELLLFDISPDGSDQTYTDPDFFYTPKKPDKQSEPHTLKPKVVLLKHKHMSSVLAIRHDGWIVFFIGTTDGILLKFAVDINHKPTCPKVLYRASREHEFPKIHLDQADPKHVYFQFKNKIERVPVSKCGIHRKVKDCLSAQDPHCVWCVSADSCTFKDHCTDSEWLSIPNESQKKMVSHQVVKDSHGKIKLMIQTHLTVEQKLHLNFSCEFSTNSSQLCGQHGLSAHFPQCTCILLDNLLTDAIDVTIKINLGKAKLTEQRKLINCSNIHGQPGPILCLLCIRAGCQWIEDSCSWANQRVQYTQDHICPKMEAGMNISMPDIGSIRPSVVSLYGKNHALLLGHHLSNVIGVRIQPLMECSPQECPVWNKTGISLTFHIPSTETKRVVKVCLLLPDGSCHGSATITYQSSPVCTDIVPRSSWRSGKRKVKLIGTHLDFVEGMIQSHAHHQVSLPKNRSFQMLTYETPAAGNTQICSSTVLMKVANKTLACLVNLTYHPDPEFTGFTTERLAHDTRIIIHKNVDKLEMTTTDLLVWGILDEKQHPCILKVKENSNKTDSLICEIQGIHNANFKDIKIKYGDTTVWLKALSSLHLALLIVHFLLKFSILTVLVVICVREKRRSSSDY